MGCICPKAASAEDQVTETPPKAKASSKAQLRHFNGSARIETMEALNNFLVEKDREKTKPRSKQNDGRQDSMDRRRRQYTHALPNPRLGNVPEQIKGEQAAAGWPSWFTEVAGEAIKGWIPRRADSFEKLDKIGQGTYSNVYKARDLSTGKIVALKKVRFDSSEPESVKFMAREIQILRRLDHPNVVKLEGLVTSRMSSSLYLVFEYMEHDLAGLAACPGIMFTEPQVKCYMQQLLKGLDHCHTRGVLHRDIKGSNLLIDNDGLLKIADFGLATFYDPSHKLPLTSRVVTLWYRPPELLLGATDYGVGVDLWSTGCILAELLAGKPIMPGRTEVEQLHRIFKLCGSPSEAYWKRLKVSHSTLFKPQQAYKRCLAETFKDLPPTALALLETLLAIEPADRGVASAALKSDFFTSKPYPCDPKLLPKYPPSKEFDAKVREEEARRHRAVRHGAADTRRHGSRERSRAGPAPDANAELPLSLQKRRMPQASTKSKSEKFPSASSEKTATGFPIEPPPSRQGRQATDIRASSPVPHRRVAPPPSSRSGPLDAAANATWTMKEREDDVRMAPPRPASRSMRITSDSRHWQAGKREEEGDFTRRLRYSLRAEQQRKPELDTRRSDVLQGPMQQQQLPNAPESRDPQLTSKVGYDERMYYSGPLLRPGLSAAVDIEELLEEHERKLKQAVRRANQEHSSKPGSNSSGKHD